MCQNKRSEHIYTFVKKRYVIVFGLVFLQASAVMAMSVGRHRGAALIGRPLDISVQAVLDAQEDISGVCLDADVFYADSKVEKSRVKVTAEKTSPGSQDVVIHVRSLALVDEPVVTFYLRVGCQQKTERRYVVLSDLVSEAAAGSVALALPKTGSAGGAPAGTVESGLTKPLKSPDSNSRAGRIAAQGPGAVADSTAYRGGALLADTAKPALRISKDPADATSDSRKRGKEKIKGQATAQSDKTPARLKLEPLNLTIDRDPSLKFSAELLSVPTSSADERSAAAALWRALTAQPEDILRDAQKLQTLENSMRGLKAQAQKDQAAVVDLNTRLATAQSERYANGLVYGLLALLVAGIAAITYLLRKRSVGGRAAPSETPWWKKSAAQQPGWADSAQDDALPETPSSIEAKKRSLIASKKLESAPLDLDLTVDANRSVAGKGAARVVDAKNAVKPLAEPRQSSRYPSDFALSMTHPARAVKAEELFDVQQQADFFVSLGQYEQAIEVLRTHIGDNKDTSALVYLDLFNLYHQLKRAADYEALRVEFNLHFNAKIPPFELYDDKSPGLESYQLALTRIEALWPSAKVLEVIEESIFRRPDANAEPFDLEAYRELLLLYAVAKEIIHPETPVAIKPKPFDLPGTRADDLGVKPTKFASTSIQPLSASISESPLQVEMLTALVLPLPSSRLGLDLDLSEPANAVKVLPPALQSDSDSKFFMAFDVDASTSAPAFGAPAADNLIDFESFDASVSLPDRLPPTKP